MTPETTATSIRCTDCNQNVRLMSADTTGLIVSCGCSTRSVKVAKALPEAWSA